MTQNINNAKFDVLLFPKIPKSRKNHPINPSKDSLGLGKKEEEIYSLRRLITN